MNPTTDRPGPDRALGSRHAPGEHRTDAIFTLPVLPKTAAVLGDLAEWRAGLTDRGVEVVDGSRSTPDLVVTSDLGDDRILESRASCILTDGPALSYRMLRRTGRHTQRILPVPRRGNPVLMVPIDQRRASGYGVLREIVHPERWRMARNRLAGHLLRLGLLPPLRSTITTASRLAGPPALLSAARHLGVEPHRRWILLVSTGSPVRRDAFLLFRPGEGVPDLALKFSRIPGRHAKVEREERGLTLAAAAGPSIAARAPRFLGSCELDGYHAVLETAVVGTKLASLLRRPLPIRSKLGIVDRVVDWLIGMARETRAPPENLRPERHRLATQVLPFWASRGVSEDMLRHLDGVPSVFRHYDLGDENVVVRSGEFGVVDWEWAQEHGMPLADLAWFASAVLRIVDGALREEDRLPHFTALWGGRAPSSGSLFRWIGAMVEALALPVRSVGPLLTLTWLDRGKHALVEHRRAESDTGRMHERPYQVHRAVAWLEQPGLGPGWRAWETGG